jgi:tetratricopeptide (TPR) repeat protein
MSLERRAVAALLACVLAAPATQASPAATVAAHTWTGVRTPHLEVVTDAPRATAMRVALRLENLHRSLARLLPELVVEASPVQVIVFRDASLAQAYAPTWRGLHDDVAGFSHAGPDRRRVVYADDQGRTPSVAQHEYVHSLLDVACPDVPLWLNEGLAEYFSTFTSDESRAVLGAPIYPHIEWLAGHDLMPLYRLFAIDHASPEYHEGDRRGTFYAQSWALTHLLLSASEGDVDRLGRVLAACGEGTSFEAAFDREFGSDQGLRGRLSAYLEAGNWSQRMWQMEAPSGAAALRVRERVPAAEVLGSLALELLSRPVPQREDAEAHLRQALALDARAPDALAGMGWLELQRGRRTEARAWFDRALAVSPVSATAVRTLGSQLLIDAAGRQAPDERAALAKYVRDALERALAVSPDDPELVALLARSWAVGDDDPEQGYVLAVRAAHALPGRRDVQLDLLALASLTGRDSEAQRIYDARFGNGAPADARHAAGTALLAGAVHRAGLSARAGDVAGAEARLEAARAQLADDPGLARQAQGYLDSLRTMTRRASETAQANEAIDEYNRGVNASNAQHYAEAETAFRRAAAISDDAGFQARSLRLATRMHQQQDGERAFALARAGRVDEAIAIFEAMDRATMSAEDRKWLDANLAQLRARRR